MDLETLRSKALGSQRKRKANEITTTDEGTSNSSMQVNDAEEGEIVVGRVPMTLSATTAGDAAMNEAQLDGAALKRVAHEREEEELNREGVRARIAPAPLWQRRTADLLLCSSSPGHQGGIKNHNRSTRASWDFARLHHFKRLLARHYRDFISRARFPTTSARPALDSNIHTQRRHAIQRNIG